MGSKADFLINNTGSYSVISELRTPLLEILLSAQKTNDQQTALLADQTLKLFDNYLFWLDIKANDQQLDLFPCSVNADTESVLHKLYPLAKSLGVKLSLKSKHNLKTAQLNRPAFAAGLHSLVYAGITDVQAEDKPEIMLDTVSGIRPSLRLFSSNLNLENFDAQIDLGHKRRQIGQSVGFGSGYSIARGLFETFGSKLVFSANQHGRTLSTSFAPTTQLSLI